MQDRRYVQDLTTEELEQELLTRRREERLARVRRVVSARRAEQLSTASTLNRSPILAQGRMAGIAIDPLLREGPEPAETQEPRPKTLRDRILLGIEIAALIGLVIVIVSFAANVQRLNRDWKGQNTIQDLPDPTATPLIRVSILPGGHRPPAMEGGEAEPVGIAPKVAIPTTSPRSPTRLVIPAIDIDVPVVEGVDWEQLKKGAGHLIGSANPGERGNCFIAGHNDIYGEIFRYLEELKVGDEILVYAGKQAHRYTVRATRIVEPDDVSVMATTSTPVLTLLTCYPYMIDSHRLVVIAELDR
jgi:sortase A